MICLGNRRNAIFWHDKWLNGSTPIDIALNLYKLPCFKSRMVARELRNKSWMGAARHISSREELVEFIKLWSLIKNIKLREEENDHIQWKWTPNGEYFAASAYHLQFQGSHPPFQTGQLWKARTEPKVKTFGWTAMHQRIPMAEILTARGMESNQMCLLCNACDEDARHLLT
jgi:hypothetical protein